MGTSLLPMLLMLMRLSVNLPPIKGTETKTSLHQFNHPNPIIHLSLISSNANSLWFKGRTSLMDLPAAKQLKFKYVLVLLLSHHLHTILPNLEALSLLRMQGRKYINQVFLNFDHDFLNYCLSYFNFMTLQNWMDI